MGRGSGGGGRSAGRATQAFSREITFPDTLRPAGRVRYQRGSIEETVTAAARLSINDSLPRYVLPTAFGFTISLDRPSFVGYWQVEGRRARYYPQRAG